MSHTAYILTAWLVPSAAIAAYAARLVQRGRRLSRAVAPDRRRWMSADSDPRRPKP